MSVVYQGVHRNGKRVAIKVLHPELTLRTRTRRRFLREGYIANRVAHPSAVSVLDDGIADDGTVFLVMELLEGETIGQQLRRNAAAHTTEQVLAVADAVLDVLACAHDRGIVHRDVKPDNVFVTFEGCLKLLDFGIASLRELSLGSDTTRTGPALGTPAFMAPEQARGRPGAVDPRSDLWAVGATMFTLLTQRHVHEGQSHNESLFLAATRPAPSLGDLVQERDRAIAEVVDRALAFAISDRWPDARSMQRELRAASAGRVLSLPVPRGPAHGVDAEQTSDDATPEPADSAWTRRSADSSRETVRGLRASRAFALALSGAITLFATGLVLQLKPPAAAPQLRPLPLPRTTVLRKARPAVPLPQAAERSAGVEPSADRLPERGGSALVTRPRRAPQPPRITGVHAAEPTPATQPGPPRVHDPHLLLSDDLLDQRN